MAAGGRNYGEKDELDKAITDFDTAIRLDKNLAWAFYARGVAFERKGEKSKAEADFAEAKKLGYKAAEEKK